MLPKLPTEIQLLAAKFCTVRSLFKLRASCRQMCNVVSQRRISVLVHVIVEDEEGPIKSELDLSWTEAELLLTIPSTYDVDDYEEAGPLGSFYVPEPIMLDCEKRLRGYFSPKAAHLPAPPIRVTWFAMQLVSQLSTTGALMRGLSKRAFNEIHCTLSVARCWPCLPGIMNISIFKASLFLSSLRFLPCVFFLAFSSLRRNTDLSSTRLQDDALGEPFLDFIKGLLALSCRVKLHFAITSIPPASLLKRLSELRVRFQIEGAVFVDSVASFLSMHPRPPRIYWPVTATNECVQTGLLMAQPQGSPSFDRYVPVPKNASVLAHIQYCCLPHISLATDLIARLYPGPLSSVILTCDRSAGVRILSNRLKELWGEMTMKTCLKTRYEDIL